MPLEVLKGLLPPGSVPQEGPERRRRDAVLTDRERPDLRISVIAISSIGAS